MSKYSYKKNSNLQNQTFSILDYEKRLNMLENKSNENIKFEIRFFFTNVIILLATLLTIHKNVK